MALQGQHRVDGVAIAASGGHTPSSGHNTHPQHTQVAFRARYELSPNETAALEAEFPILYGQFAGRRNPDIDEGGVIEGSPSSKDRSLTIDEAEEDVSDLEEPG